MRALTYRRLVVDLCRPWFSMCLPHDLHDPDRMWLEAPQVGQFRMTRWARDAAESLADGTGDGDP
jgi:hypothetical protein